MTNLILLVTLAAFFAVLFYWAFKNLPAEHWQIIAAVPFQRCDDGTWNGVNFTYYGFFNATACVFSCAALLTLMGSVAVPVITTVLITCLLLLFCLPAAKVLARIIERKTSTFTIGGASFVGIVLLPLIIQGFNTFAAETSLTVPVTQMLAAVAIAYAFGEAFGRLACISFGCCYGKLLWQAPAPVQKLLRRFCFTFSGATKKVAYEADLLDRPLIPIQAVTAIISAVAGLSGVFFFVNSHWTTAMMVPIVVTQTWRVFSETLRSDYRGGGRISAYQVMAIVALVYSLGWAAFLAPVPAASPDILLGLGKLLSASVLVFLEMLWVAIFVDTGRSSVTAARLSFHVVRERI